MFKVIAGRKAELKTKDCGGSDCAKGCDGGGRGSGCTVAMLEATAEAKASELAVGATLYKVGAEIAPEWTAEGKINIVVEATAELKTALNATAEDQDCV